MNNNLKKVISAASALAVSATGIAAFAASYPDVPATADYYQAVTELSALNVINGMDDGTYQPEANVTRAQITKMIVTALGNTAVSAAEAAANKDTQFADVTANHWAAGFIATGTSSTASNFINGYSATQFGPEDNVTYAQAIKMLVCALGYSSFAKNEGDWPSGYLKYGYSLELTKGLTGIGNDQQLNRAQVAILIDNALKCPICVSDGYTYNMYGQSIPKALVKNGTGDLSDTKDGYQNLLNFAHNAYLVYGRVDGTFKTGAGVDSDEVRFNVEKANNWEGYEVPRYNDVENVPVYKGAVTDADNYLFTYAEAIIQKDDNDEYTFIALTPYGASETKEVATDYFKRIDNGSNYYSVQMYKDDRKSSYETLRVENDVEYYINGREASTIDGCSTFEDFMNSDYVANNKVGTISFIDATDEGKSSTDGRYDYAMVSYYLDAVVDEISVTDEDAKIYFDEYALGLDPTMDFDFEDDDKEYNVTLNGEPIEVKDIQEGDVLSIAFDVEAGAADSDSYDIIVSRDTVEGRVSNASADSDPLDVEYTLDNGNVYTRAFDGVGALTSGTTYTLYLDAFGKVVKADELLTTKKYALLENVYTVSGGSDYEVEVALNGGTTARYSVDKETFDRLANILMKEGQSIDGSDKMSNRKDPQDRVINYTVNSKNELKLRANEDGEYAAVEAEATIDGTYKSNTSKLDTAKVSENITQFIDISDYTDDDRTFGSLSYDALRDGTTYKGYAYGRSSGDKVYQFILITDGVSGYNVSNGMAVFVQTVDTEVDGSSAQAVQAYVNGTLETLVLENEGDADDLTVGDVFFYKMSAEDEIEAPRVALSAGLNVDYNTFYNNAVKAEFNLVNEQVANQFANEDAAGAFNRDDDIRDCELVFGAIVESESGEVKVATPAELASANQSIDAVNVNRIKAYDIADDANVYVYNYGASGKRLKDRLSVGARGSLRAASFSRDAYVNEDKDSNVLDLTSSALTGLEQNENYGQVTLAFLKVVDGDVAEALVITPDTKKK